MILFHQSGVDMEERVKLSVFLLKKKRRKLRAFYADSGIFNGECELVHFPANGDIYLTEGVLLTNAMIDGVIQ